MEAFRGRNVGTSDVWKITDQYRAGEVTDAEMQDLEAGLNRSHGSCNIMGTASTMASMVEVLGVGLPDNASIPAVDSRRNVLARMAGRRIVDLVREGVVIGQILTRGGVRGRRPRKCGDRRINECGDSFDGPRVRAVSGSN